MDIIKMICLIIRILLIAADVLGIFIDPMISEGIEYIDANSIHISLKLMEIWLWLRTHF